MNLFEIAYSLAFPFLPNIYTQVRYHLFPIVRCFPTAPTILDVGGRKSHYTIGLPARITISDLPRNSEVQHRLHLGINQDIIQQTSSRRSNVIGMVYDDMTQSNLADNSFDIVLAVEVLEHVVEDQEFLTDVRRVLKPGGFFLMTTPNGDYVKNTNPDHIRHYKRDELLAMLETKFNHVRIIYAVRSSKYFFWGLGSWSLTKPVKTIKSMIGNWINRIESNQLGISSSPKDTRHLLAIAQKSEI